MIKVTVRGIEKVQEFIATVQRGFKAKAAEAVTQYILGIEKGGSFGTHGLTHYPPYHHVTIQQAYGGFVSDKQRRYVMARIREGTIQPGYPHRTGELQRAWDYKDTGSGRYTIINPCPYAPFVMGDKMQANLPRLVGWRKTMDIVQSNLQGAFRYARARLKEWIAEQRRKQ